MKKGRRRKQKGSNMLEKRGIEKGRNRINYEGIWDKERCSKKSWHKFVYLYLFG